MPGWSTLKKLIWLYRANGAGGGGGTETTITGVSPLLLAAALKKPIKSLTQFGLCSQSGTPTPAASVPIMCNNGKLQMLNLANMKADNIVVGKYINNNGNETSAPSNFYYSPFIPVKASTAYTLKTSRSLNYANFMEYDASKGFLQRTLYGSADTPAGAVTTHTTRADTAYIRFGSNINGQTLTANAVLAIEWMFTEGATPMDYVPNGQLSVVGTDEVISVGGKNLIDISTVGIEQGAISSSAGDNTNSVYRVRTAGYVPVRPSTQYTLSCVIDGYSSGSSRGIFVLEYADASVAGYTGDSSGWKAPDGYTFTTGATTSYIRIVFAAGSTSATPTVPEDVSKVQFEYGDTATEYQPYVAPQTATAPDLFAVGDYADVVEIIGGAVTRRIGWHIFDGTESFSTSTAYGKAFLINAAASAWGARRNNAVLCTHFLGLPQVSSAQEDYTCFFNQTGHFYFRVPDNSDVEAFKVFLAEQYAAGTPVIVLYALAEETTESVTPQELHTNAGDNIITVTAIVSPIQLEATYIKETE